MYLRQPQKRKSICSGDVLYWITLIALAGTCLVTVISLQKNRKENNMLKWRLEETGSSRVHERNLLHNRLTKLEKEIIQVEKERDDIMASQKNAHLELKKAQEEAKRKDEKIGSYDQLQMQLRETERRLSKAEKEVKEITVKAGSCQREFANLNANYETVKQDVNTFAQELSTTKNSNKQDSKGQKVQKEVEAGELDPRGGMEAAKVLNDELPGTDSVSNKLQTDQKVDTDFMRAHPLKIGEDRDKYKTDLDTSEGLERENVGNS